MWFASLEAPATPSLDNVVSSMVLTTLVLGLDVPPIAPTASPILFSEGASLPCQKDSNLVYASFWI
jgi:hypothetical protein